MITIDGQSEVVMMCLQLFHSRNGSVNVVKNCSFFALYDFWREDSMNDKVYKSGIKFQIFHYLEKILCSVFNTPALPVACPKCGDRNSNIQPYVFDGKYCSEPQKRLTCTNCEIVFSKEKPLKYRYTLKKHMERTRRELQNLKR